MHADLFAFLLSLTRAEDGSHADVCPDYLQECAGLQGTGVADAQTWKALLGADAEPAHLADLRADDATDEDLSEIGDRVWLLGEQRWARKL